MNTVNNFETFWVECIMMSSSLIKALISFKVLFVRSYKNVIIGTKFTSFTIATIVNVIIELELDSRFVAIYRQRLKYLP